MAKQKLGQNFLHDKNIAGRITDLVSANGKIVVEIGPGKGVMTKILADSPDVNRVVAIEMDSALSQELASRELDGVELLNGDILKIDPAGISDGAKITLLGNIPYYISKEIIDWIINGNEIIERGALMVQKEFFEKITSYPGTKIYNAQSVTFGTIYSSKKEFEVRPGAFTPPPKVTSTVFTFTKRGQVPIPGDINQFYIFLKTAFSHRRKTLLNNLSKDYNKDKIKKLLKANNLSENIRAENITPENLENLYKHL